MAASFVRYKYWGTSGSASGWTAWGSYSGRYVNNVAFPKASLVIEISVEPTATTKKITNIIINHSFLYQTNYGSSTSYVWDAYLTESDITSNAMPTTYLKKVSVTKTGGGMSGFQLTFDFSGLSITSKKTLYVTFHSSNTTYAAEAWNTTQASVVPATISITEANNESTIRYYSTSTTAVTYTGTIGTTKTISFPTPPAGKIFAGFHCFNSNLSGIISRDSVFENGNGSVVVYNNSGNGTVAITRQTETSTPVKGLGSSTVAYSLKIAKAAGTATPGMGGFQLPATSQANKIFRHVIVAKIPRGYFIEAASNSCGNNYYRTWLTPQVGTGDWFTYVYDLHCGSTGSFSTFGHVYLKSDDNTAAVTWYVAATQITDVTSTSVTATYASSDYSIECFYADIPYVKINVNGTWKNAIPYVNDNGTWKQTMPYIKSDGYWKPISS